MSPLSILYQDDYLVAINKPNGLAVHKSKLVGNTNEFALQLLRNQIKKHVYPIHRLDRKTSGVLLFALSPKVNEQIQMQFREKSMEKMYWAIVRGYVKENELINYPLINNKGTLQQAITQYFCKNKSEINIPLGKWNTSRYSLIEIYPKTGRTHQIRKHLNHIRHPIIGDRPHGCNKQNKLFKEKWNITNMMLHAKKLKFTHPVSKEKIEIFANLPNEFLKTLEILNLN